MNYEIEVEIEHNITIFGEVDVTDISHDDESGKQDGFEYTVTNFELTVWLQDMPYSLNALIDEKQRESLENLLIEKAMKSHESSI